MTAKHSLFFTFIVLGMTLPIASSSAAQPPVVEPPIDAPGSDRIVMVLDGEPYTQTELAKFFTLRSGKPFHIKELSRSELNEVLQQFSMQEMVKREASAVGFTTADADVEAYIDEIKKQNNMDEEALAVFLKDKGISRESYVDQVKFEIVRNRLFAAKVRPKVALADEEANKHLKEQLKKDEEAAVDGYVIEQLIYPGSTPKEELEAVYERAKNGEDLKVVGGDAHFVDLGVVNPENLKEELRKITEDMSIGDVSEPTFIENSWFIQKRVASLRAAPLAKDDPAKAQEFERKFKAAADKYLSEELPKKYSPEFKL